LWKRKRGNLPKQKVPVGESPGTVVKKKEKKLRNQKFKGVAADWKKGGGSRGIHFRFEGRINRGGSHSPQRKGQERGGKKKSPPWPGGKFLENKPNFSGRLRKNSQNNWVGEYGERYKNGSKRNPNKWHQWGKEPGRACHKRINRDPSAHIGKRGKKKRPR